MHQLHNEPSYLKLQRNVISAIAGFILVIGVSVSLPRELQQRSDLKWANERLLRLQEDLRKTNQDVVSVQAEIGKVQHDIEQLLKSSH